MVVRWKKEIIRKRLDSINGLSLAQIIDFDLNTARNEKQIEIAQKIHSELFSEETDRHYDSSWDTHDRKNGINPMSAAYSKRANAKRLEMGFKSLDKDGQAIDEETFNFILNAIKNNEQHKIDLLVNINVRYTKA
ncbi:MAG: hypothetical protein OCD03_09870 [Hyphomicrobiales bacterium]